MSDPITPGKPAALGDFERIPFPSLVYTLYKKRFTGYVSLREGGKPTTVYFREGTPVAALLPTQTEHLGRVLLDTGVIDEATWEESLRRLRETGERQGEILIAMGKITEEQLTAGLKLQLRRKLTGLFGIAMASFEVYAVDHQFGRAAELSQMRVHPRRIIYGGIRGRYTAERLDRDARDLESYAARVTAEAAGSLDKYGFEEADRPVVESLRSGYHTVVQLCAATGCERLVVRQILYTLWVTEALEFADPATLTVAAPAAAPPAARAPSAASAAPASAAPAAAAPTPAAPGPASRSALEAPITSSTLKVLRPRLKPPQVPVPTPSPTQTSATAAAVTRPATPAPGSVSRPPTPLAGTAAVGSNAGPKVPTPVPVPTPTPARRPTGGRPVTPVKPGETGGVSALVGQKLRSEVEARFNQIEKQNLFQVLGLDVGASKDQVRAAYLELAKLFHPDRVPAQGTGELRPKMERIFSRISEAHATLGDDQARKKYEQTLRDASKGDSTRAQRILEGEIAFQKGTVLLRRKDWAPAIAELRRAVTLNADEAEHHALLAWALWQASSDKVKAAAEAKPMLQKAVGLQARSHHAHFFLGEILMAEGALPQALQSYQRVLMLDPDNVDAQRAVRLINLRLEKEAKKGGLFDRFRKK